ncbi:coatomer subunit delta-like protein [Tanacetum coccineum]
MVVLAASIVSKSGKALVSRPFVEMSRIRIEGLLAAFPKLIGSGKQHTYVETENVRYVYQPMEGIYLVLVTNKQSNILEDLDTLRLLSKVVPEFSGSLDEEGICKNAFELIFAFDEVISLGHKENVTVAQVRQYCEMDSHEERLHKEAKQSKMDDARNEMIRRANEIEQKKSETAKLVKGGYSSLQSMDSMGSMGRMDNGFSNDMGISSGNTFGSGSGFGITSDVDSFSSKPKGRPSVAVTSPAKGMGMRLGKSQKANQFLESLKAEGEMIVEDVRPSANLSKAAGPSPTDPVTLTAEEKLNVTLKRDGGLSNFDVQGTLSLQILNQDDGFIQVQGPYFANWPFHLNMCTMKVILASMMALGIMIESAGNPEIKFNTHPNINKDLFSNENILGSKDPNRPFPAGQSGDGLGLLKWRMQSKDESAVPLTINCWPSVSGNETYVSIEYEASSMFDLQNVVISVPLSALRDAPNVKQIDGEWSGSMEFVVPPADTSAFFPISVRFSATSTFSDMKVASIVPLKGGPPPKYSQRTQLFPETSFEVLKLLENNVEVLKILENKLESMKILENKLESLKL